jgi:hypothetical protein
MTRDRYGPLAAPEGKTHIEVVEDPVAIARSAYAAWHAGASRQTLVTDSTDYSEPVADQLYTGAAQLVGPHARAFQDLPAKDLEAILASVQPDGASGLFLSALLNATAVEKLDGVFKHRILGYRLAPGKTVVARPESELLDLGRHAESGIVNWGFAFHFAQDAHSGIQVNLGKAGLMAYKSGGGAQLNYGQVNDLLGGWANGGVQVNFGEVSRLAYSALGGIQVNHGRVNESMADYAYGGIQANYGFAWKLVPCYPGSLQAQYGRSKEGHNWRLRQNMRRFRPLYRELRLKCKALGQTLRNYATDPWLDYDFATFESEAQALGKKLMERK